MYPHFGCILRYTHLFIMFVVLSIFASVRAGFCICVLLWSYAYASFVSAVAFVLGGGNLSVSSVLGLLSWMMQHHGFKPSSEHPVEGILFLGLSMGSDSTPYNSLGWEYKLRSFLCTHAFYCVDIHILDGWMLATKKHPAHTIQEIGMWLPLWLDWKTVTKCKYLTKNGDHQRSGWDRRCSLCFMLSCSCFVLHCFLQSAMTKNKIIQMCVVLVCVCIQAFVCVCVCVWVCVCAC